MSRAVMLTLAMSMVAACAPEVAPKSAVETAPLAAPSGVKLGGTLASGAKWVGEVPANWNGTLLVWSRGYSPVAGEPGDSPRGAREVLLREGYALVGSNYGAGGWSLEEAVPAQIDTVRAFTETHKAPKRVIAWGGSMGGLVSTAIAEQPNSVAHGAIALCASIGGATGMMNMGLDGAYTFRTLVAPDAGIRVVDIDDDRVNAKRVIDALAVAMQSPEGRARFTLAAVMGGIPGWTTADKPAPAADDYEAQVAEMARAFPMGVFLPRTDQEARAGGAFSWNDTVDYRVLLDRSGRRALVEAMYRKAGLDLNADLARLNAAERIKAKPQAVDYMMRNYTPTAAPTVPLLAVQMIGDGLTSPSLQRDYADAAKGSDVKSVYFNNAGHCNFNAEQYLASLRYLDERLSNGSWGKGSELFVAHTPTPMPRSCYRGKKCE